MSSRNTPQVHQALLALSTTVREMTPLGAKPIPAVPVRFNLLARPAPSVCGFCGLPGHYSGRSLATLTSALPCRAALVSLLGFWTDVLDQLRVAHAHSARFRAAVASFEAVYALGFEGARAPPLPGGDVEGVLVDALARAWVRFGGFVARVRTRMLLLVPVEELVAFEGVTGELNGLLLGGLSLSELFERSLTEEMEL